MFVIAAMFAANVCGQNNSSNIVRVGDSFMHRGSEGGNRIKADTLITKYKYETRDASYPIIMNKSTGSCYVWRKSKKTGKMYRSYVGEEISRTICKELGVGDCNILRTYFFNVFFYLIK